MTLLLGKDALLLVPFLELRLGWEFPVNQQKRYFQEGTLFSKLLDWVSSVLEHTHVAINKRNLGCLSDEKVRLTQLMVFM